MSISVTGHGFTAGVLLAALAVPMPSQAGTTQAQFGIVLVIEPACPGDAPKLVATTGAAISLASEYLQIAPQDLRAQHDRDTGYWLVRSTQGPALRIAKCTGEVERL